MIKKKKSFFIIGMIGVLILLCIQWGLRFNLSSSATIINIPHILSIHLTYATNRGISFSLLSHLPVWVLSVIGLGISCIVFVVGMELKKPLYQWGLYCIGIGGITNALDRLFFHNVFDYFILTVFSWNLFIFNTPDFFITLGFILCICGIVFNKSTKK